MPMTRLRATQGEDDRLAADRGGRGERADPERPAGGAPRPSSRAEPALGGGAT